MIMRHYWNIPNQISFNNSGKSRFFSLKWSFSEGFPTFYSPWLQQILHLQAKWSIYTIALFSYQKSVISNLKTGTADCELSTYNWGLPTVDCRLWTEDWSWAARDLKVGAIQFAWLEKPGFCAHDNANWGLRTAGWKLPTNHERPATWKSGQFNLPGLKSQVFALMTMPTKDYQLTADSW